MYTGAASTWEPLYDLSPSLDVSLASDGSISALDASGGSVRRWALDGRWVGPCSAGPPNVFLLSVRPEGQSEAETWLCMSRLAGMLQRRGMGQFFTAWDLGLRPCLPQIMGLL